MNNKIFKVFWILAKELAKENGISGFIRERDINVKKSSFFVFKNKECIIRVCVHFCWQTKDISSIYFNIYDSINFSIDYKDKNFQYVFLTNQFCKEHCNRAINIQNRFLELLNENLK